MLAELREDFVDRTLALPLSTVERAGTGDLLTRTSRDVDALSWTVRFAVPETLIAVVTACSSSARCVLVGPLLALPCLLARAAAVGRHPVVPAPRARTATCARAPPTPTSPTGSAETVEGARTVEALRPAGAGVGRRTDADIRRSYAAERYTLLPAHGLLPGRGDRLPGAGGGDAAARRLALPRGLGHARPGHRGDALRAAADRPGRPDALLAGRAAGRRRVAGPAARASPTRARRPRRPPAARPPTRRAARRPRGRAVRLRGRAATCCTAST